MKNPDALLDGIDDAIKEEIEELQLPPDEAEALFEVRQERIKKIASKWFEYGEYLSVQIDTESESIAVLPVNP